MSSLTDRRDRAWNVLEGLVESIFEASDAEVAEDFVEQGSDPDALDARLRALTEAAIEKSRREAPKEPELTLVEDVPSTDLPSSAAVPAPSPAQAQFTTALITRESRRSVFLRAAAGLLGVATAGVARSADSSLYSAIFESRLRPVARTEFENALQRFREAWDRNEYADMIGAANELERAAKRDPYTVALWKNNHACALARSGRYLEARSLLSALLGDRLVAGRPEYCVVAKNLVWAESHCLGLTRDYLGGVSSRVREAIWTTLTNELRTQAPCWLQLSNRRPEQLETRLVLPAFREQASLEASVGTASALERAWDYLRNEERSEAPHLRAPADLDGNRILQGLTALTLDRPSEGLRAIEDMDAEQARLGSEYHYRTLQGMLERSLRPLSEPTDEADLTNSCQKAADRTGVYYLAVSIADLGIWLRPTTRRAARTREYYRDVTLRSFSTAQRGGPSDHVRQLLRVLADLV